MIATTPFSSSKTVAGLGVALTLLLAAQAQADEKHHHQSAHTHGNAHLQVAVEGDSADLIFRSPAANLLGFEHEPRTDEQRQAVQEANTWFSETPLVKIGGNNCEVAAHAVQHLEEADEEHEHHHHDDGKQEEAASHSDYEVTQQVKCDGSLEKGLKTPLLEQFPGIEHLAVDWVSSTGQGQTTLEAGESEVELTP